MRQEHAGHPYRGLGVRFVRVGVLPHTLLRHLALDLQPSRHRAILQHRRSNTQYDLFHILLVYDDVVPPRYRQGQSRLLAKRERTAE